jgi:hypothetical protein
VGSSFIRTPSVAMLAIMKLCLVLEQYLENC